MKIFKVMVFMFVSSCSFNSFAIDNEELKNLENLEKVTSQKVLEVKAGKNLSFEDAKNSLLLGVVVGIVVLLA